MPVQPLKPFLFLSEADFSLEPDAAMSPLYLLPFYLFPIPIAASAFHPQCRNPNQILEGGRVEEGSL